MDDDVLVDGRSLRLAAKQKMQVQIQITEFFKLLVPELEGESLQDLTYEEIEAEFPMSVQMQMLEKISESISPTYKEIKGNWLAHWKSKSWPPWFSMGIHKKQ